MTGEADMARDRMIDGTDTARDRITGGTDMASRDRLTGGMFMQLRREEAHSMQGGMIRVGIDPIGEGRS